METREVCKTLKNTCKNKHSARKTLLQNKNNTLNVKHNRFLKYKKWKQKIRYNNPLLHNSYNLIIEYKINKKP
jgi:hypothetical protein